MENPVCRSQTLIRALFYRGFISFDRPLHIRFGRTRISRNAMRLKRAKINHRRRSRHGDPVVSQREGEIGKAIKKQGANHNDGYRNTGVIAAKEMMRGMGKPRGKAATAASRAIYRLAAVI
jgi:hypothetical protein